MSWIFGIIPQNGENYTESLSRIGNDKFLSYNSNKIQFCAGGLRQNLYFSKQSNWVVAGIGLLPQSQNTKILNQNDWESLFKRKDFEDKLKQLNGHFIVIRWYDNKVSFYSDVLGLREIYLLKNNNGVFFSTNATLLSKFNNLELDFSQFGSRWMLFNQISDKSIFKNVVRVIAGKTATVSLGDKNISINNYNWLPSNSEKKYELKEYYLNLTSLINLNIPETHHVSLSLSGGMDSRVILSCLLKNNLSFDTHTFGDPNHPDSLIAKKIANSLNLKHEQINLGLPGKDKIIQDISGYSSQTLVNNAASAILQLQNYRVLNGRNIVLVDGGFGEIWRREFFYKLFLRGKKALFEKDIDKIIPHLMLHRADIFNNDSMLLMKNGIENQLEELFEKLPKIKKNNSGNWLDIFAIKTRIANYYSHEQSRLDNNLVSIMPFLQPTLLSELNNMPISLRQNGKLFRKIIKLNSPVLKNFALVKGEFTHPFFMGSLQSRLLNLIQRKLGFNRYQGNTSLALLNSLKEFIYDTINSKTVIETPFYNIIKIRKIVDEFYAGNEKYSNELDWFLSFELFRQKYQND